MLKDLAQREGLQLDLRPTLSQNRKASQGTSELDVLDFV